MEPAKKILLGLFLLILVLVQSPAQAFNSNSFNGTADFYAGYTPPPGLHLVDYTYYLDIKKVENKGQGIIDGKGSLSGWALRPVYVFDKQILGGNPLVHAVIPVYTVEASVQTILGPGSGHDGGLGDIYVGTGIGWHGSTWHQIAGLQIITPTGHFDPNKPINVGSKEWIIEPVYLVSGLFANGFELSAFFHFSYHTENSDYVEAGTGLKGYQTAPAFHVDYTIGQAITQNFRVGIAGWYWQGLSDDKIGGKSRNDTKDQEFSAGPALRYQSGRFGIMGKYVIPVTAENRVEAKQLWVDLVYSF